MYTKIKRENVRTLHDTEVVNACRCCCVGVVAWTVQRSDLAEGLLCFASTNLALGRVFFFSYLIILYAFRVLFVGVNPP